MAKPDPPSGRDMTPDEALNLLKEGNSRFLSGVPTPPQLIGREQRLALAKGQKPFCVLVGCSDSRVAPELLFGRGLGELFIIRNAGNVVDLTAMGSIEYAVAMLGAPLIVVLGHERCGAVQAAVNVVENDATYPGSIGQMIEPIIPAVLRASRAGPSDLWTRAIKENVLRIVRRLRSTEQMLVDPLKEGKLKIVGAYYDLDTGGVEFLE